MALIKVTGYIDTDELSPDDVDLSDEMGLSSKGYEYMASKMAHLGIDDADFKLEEGD